ncbi:hypothetical protein ACU61A_39970 [Pseudonocardia sichuanensis]
MKVHLPVAAVAVHLPPSPTSPCRSTSRRTWGDWSSLTKFRISGPDAGRFPSAYCANTFRTFEVERIKHSIPTNEDGKVLGEGLLYRAADDEFRYTRRGRILARPLVPDRGVGRRAVLDSPRRVRLRGAGPGLDRGHGGAHPIRSP